MVFIKEHSTLSSYELQFGFKEHVSITQCTFVMSEIICYYKASRINVYCMLLAATKASDRVKYCTFFRNILNKDMSLLVVGHLLYMYNNQLSQI